MISPIVLIGLRCAGKSSVGRLLAKELKLDFVDLDEEISLHEGSGRSAGELLEQLGEEPFRDLESVALARALSRSDLVLAAGGGALEREENRSLLRGHARVVWLDAPDAELLKRRALDGTLRPLLVGEDSAEELSLLGPSRRRIFEELAGSAFETGGGEISALAKDLAKGLRGEAGEDG